jgi:hypothetical protein
MSYTFLLGQLPNVASVLEDAIAEFEYYAAYEPDPINCAIAIRNGTYLWDRISIAGQSNRMTTYS